MSKINNDFLLDYEVKETDIENVRNLTSDTGVFSDEEIKIAAELVKETLVNPHAYKFIFLRNGNELAAYS